MRISDWSSDVCSSDLVQLSPRADYAQPNETSAANFPSSWWTLFNDPVLAGLQSRAQAGNLNLQIASERIEQSRAQLGIASSLLLPSVGVSAGYSREAISEHGKFAALGAPTRDRKSTRLNSSP